MNLKVEPASRRLYTSRIGGYAESLGMWILLRLVGTTQPRFAKWELLVPAWNAAVFGFNIHHLSLKL